MGAQHPRPAGGAVAASPAMVRRHRDCRAVRPGARSNVQPVSADGSAPGRHRSGDCASSLPVTTDTALVYDPYDYAMHEDPYPTYARLRTEAPVYRNDERDFWALTRHADVMAGFQDLRLSSTHGVSIDPLAWGPQASMTMSFLAMDPPKHTL